MANANSTAFSIPTLKVKDYSWGKIYQGTKEALVDAGLVKPEWFPGGPGMAKSSTRIAMIDGEMKVLPFGKMVTREEKEKGVIKIFRANRREFQAHIGFTAEELDRQRLRSEVEALHAKKRKELDSAPQSPQDFRESRKRCIRAFLETTFNLFRRADNGYHYSREVVEQARDLMADLLELAEDGKVYFDQKRHQYFMDDVEEKAVKAHPEFSAFMAATLAIGKAAA